MCNILILEKGVMPIKSDFVNMCNNNWHSYGLVTYIGDKLDVYREVPASGEINPEEIWKKLERDIEFTRILHVRHNTAGATSLENCHPYDVFYQERAGKEPRQVLFMHNGTLYDFKSKKMNAHNAYVDDDEGASDSKNFVDRILSPYLSALEEGNGRGDIEGPLFQGIVKKFWPGTGNRGILISSDQGFVTFGDWKSVKGQKGEDIPSANVDYFKDVIRGPEHSRRKLAKEAAEKANSKFQNGHNSSNITNLSSVSAFNKNLKTDSVLKALRGSLSGILDDWNLWDRSTAVNLGMASPDEILEIKKMSDTDFTVFLDWIFGDYMKLYEENEEEMTSHSRATKLVASLSAEIQNLKEFIKEKGYDPSTVAQNQEAA